MMADPDRISELLLSGASELPAWFHERFPPLANVMTEPTLEPLREMLANQKAQDDFLMTMAMGPKNIGKKSLINTWKALTPAVTKVGNKITNSGRPYLGGEYITFFGRPLTNPKQKGSQAALTKFRENFGELEFKKASKKYQSALRQISKSRERMKTDGLSVKNYSAAAIKEKLALRSINELRKQGLPVDPVAPFNRLNNLKFDF